MHPEVYRRAVSGDLELLDEGGVFPEEQVAGRVEVCWQPCRLEVRLLDLVEDIPAHEGERQAGYVYRSDGVFFIFYEAQAFLLHVVLALPARLPFPPVDAEGVASVPADGQC